MFRRCYKFKIYIILYYIMLIAIAPNLNMHKEQTSSNYYTKKFVLVIRLQSSFIPFKHNLKCKLLLHK